MSHISKIELEVKDLGILKQACEQLGLEMIQGQKTFKWYGREDGRCDHAIRIQGAEYEIGIIKVEDRFELRCDYWDSAIEKAIGREGGFLKKAYAVERTKTEARRKGYSVIEKKNDSGVRLHIRIN